MLLTIVPIVITRARVQEYKSVAYGRNTLVSLQDLKKSNFGTTGEAIDDSLILGNQTIATVLQTVSPLTLRRPSHCDSRLRSQLAVLV